MKEKNNLMIWIMLIVLLLLAISIIFIWYKENKNESLLENKLTNQQKVKIISENSPLTSYVYLTKNATFPRQNKIKKITIHHMAADLSLEEVGKLFSIKERKTSANYAIDKEGKIGLYVEEKNRAWTSSSPENDHQAITIEVANDEIGGNWHISDKSYNALINLCIDICKRNKIKKLNYTGDKKGNVTLHKMFKKNTECPGPYLESKIKDIVKKVNKELDNVKNY